MPCNNCGARAEWVFDNDGVADQSYCNRHVPGAYRGHPRLTPAPVEAPAEADEPEADEPAAKPVAKPAPRPRKRPSSK